MVDALNHVLTRLDATEDASDIGYFYTADGISIWVHDNISILDDELRRADTLFRFGRIARLLATFGTVDKRKSDILGMYLELVIHPGVTIRVHATTVCQRVQTGTELRPVTKTIETGEYEEVPIYDTVCPDTILGV